MKIRHHLSVTVLLAAVGCGSEDKTDAQFREEIVTGMHELLLTEIQGLITAARDLQKAAPAPIGRGWDSTDQPQIDLMKDAWIRTRVYWEQAEGTLGCLFKELDDSLDSRYEDLLANLGPEGDKDLFDGQGVTGMHAIERILYGPTPGDATSDAVIAYEMTIPGYKAAAWPANDREATEFKTSLCQRLIVDSESLLDQWKVKAIDLPVVFQGMTSLMSAQAEKLGLAVDHQEESRYSQKTMLDLRLNLIGTAGASATGNTTATRGIFDLFTPWLLTKTYGATLDSSAKMAFSGLAQTYANVAGDAIPEPPASWNSVMPTVDDQQSVFGKLYEAVVQEVDPSRSGSAVETMNQVAKALGLPVGMDCPTP